MTTQAGATNSNSNSNYVAVTRKTSDLMKNHPKTYSECVDALCKFSVEQFPGLFCDTNPIVTNLNNWEADDLAFVITEYSGWSNETIHMFLDARIRVYWEDLRKEIERNVGEEMGALTKGVPHLEMMRQGYKRELGIETDDVPRTDITLDFIKKMREIFKHKDNAFSAGALLAFECTATEEFKIVNAFLRRRKALIGGEITKNSITGIYIGEHVNPEGEPHEGEGVHNEDLHYAGLLNAIGPNINAQNVHRFIKGFLSVCLNLNIWWERLTVETYYQKMLRSELTVNDIEIPDLTRVFLAGAAHN